MAGNKKNGNLKKGKTLQQRSRDTQIDQFEEQDQNESSDNGSNSNLEELDEGYQNQTTSRGSNADNCSITSNLQENRGIDRTRSLNGGNYNLAGNLDSSTFLNVSSQQSQEGYQSTSRRSNADNCSISNLQENRGIDRTRSLNSGNYNSAGNLGSSTFLNVSSQQSQEGYQSTSTGFNADHCSITSKLQENRGIDRTRSLNGGNYKSPGNLGFSSTFLNVSTQQRPPPSQNTSPRGSICNSINSSNTGTSRNCSDISSDNSGKPKITRLANNKRSRNNDHNLVKSKYSSVYTDAVDKKHIELLRVTPNNDKKTVFRLLVCLLINIL